MLTKRLSEKYTVKFADLMNNKVEDYSLESIGTYYVTVNGSLE